MGQPLVSRPPYGEGHPRTPIAVAELPEGGPSNKGLPLDDSIPGTKTFTKPLNDQDTDPDKDESIYRVESPRDMTKDRDRIDVVDQSHSSPSYMGLGKPENSPKTKYPYRDGVPNTTNAAVFVANMWALRRSPERSYTPSSRIAANLETILNGLNPNFTQRSQECSVTLKRADLTRLRWIFSVDCGNGPKVVRMKASRKGNVVQFQKLDLHLACSCPAWRWLGPEYHADTKDYQDPNTPLQGTASTPDIRDPHRENKVCKHVAAVLSTTRNWTVPKPQKG